MDTQSIESATLQMITIQSNSATITMIFWAQPRMSRQIKIQFHHYREIWKSRMAEKRGDRTCDLALHFLIQCKATPQACVLPALVSVPWYSSCLVGLLEAVSIFVAGV